MCIHQKGESLISFTWRQAVEQARSVLAVMGFVAATGMYYDMRGLMSLQTQASITLPANCENSSFALNASKKGR